MGGVLVSPITIKSGGGDYKVNFSTTLREFSEHINVENNFYIVDKFIYENYNIVKSKFNKNIVGILDPNEKIKTLKTIDEVSDRLIALGANRTSNIVGIGGGFIQDISQFTSHIYHRGTGLILVPTTLLSMADSCIGGKCGININQFKNQVGVFKSPKSIWIYDGFTKSLTTDLLIDGYGEILKLLITKNKKETIKFLKFINENIFNKEDLSKFIKLSLVSKKTVVEVDEYERNERRILNYGHTFAHALESLSSNKIGHGQAVGFGVNLANFISFKMGYLDEKTFLEILELSYKIFNIENIQNRYIYEGQEFLKVFKTDKKTEGNHTNFILCNDYGSLRIQKLKLDNNLGSLIDEFYQINV